MKITLKACFTLTQRFLDKSGVQSSGQAKAGVVGGAGVVTNPSALCLQMYFSLFKQLSTSQSPEISPVVMATQPCFLPIFFKTKKYFLKCNTVIMRNQKHNNFIDIEYSTWHPSIEMTIWDFLSVGPFKSVQIPLIWQSNPEVLLWSSSN